MDWDDVYGCLISAAANHLRYAMNGEMWPARPRGILLALHAVNIEDQRGSHDTVVQRWWRQADFGQMRRFVSKYREFMGANHSEPDEIIWPSEVACWLKAPHD